MTSLNVVAKLTNTEILDGLILEFENTVERLVDTGSSIQITRKVEPEEGTSKSVFKYVHMRIKDIVETDFMKTRGSNELITTVQELKLVPSNDVEEQKVSVLSDLLWKQMELSKEDFLYDKSTLDRLFSENALSQCVRINNRYGVSSTRMNDINEFVNDLWVSKLGNGPYGSENPRWILVNDGTSLPTSLYNRVRNYNGFHGYRKPKTDIDSYTKSMRWLGMSYSEILDVEDLEYINSLDPTSLFSELSSVQDELKTLNEEITEYEKSISIPVSEFLELFPLVAEKLESSVEHTNKLSRKTVKVEVSQIYEVEIDVLDEDVIESTLTDVFKDASKSGVTVHLSMKNGDHLAELSSKFGGVSIVEVKDFNKANERVA